MHNILKRVRNSRNNYTDCGKYGIKIDANRCKTFLSDKLENLISIYNIDERLYVEICRHIFHGYFFDRSMLISVVFDFFVTE